MKKIIDVFSVFAIFTPQLFFSLYNIFGLQYEGSNSSNIFVYVNLIVLILILIIHLFLKIFNNFRISIRELAVILVIFIISLMYLVEKSNFGVNYQIKSSFLHFLTWGTTNIMIGYYMSKGENYRSLNKYLKHFLVIVLLSSFRTIFDSLYYNQKAQIGGATYQFAGYTYSLALGLCLYYIQDQEYKLRFKYLFFFLALILFVSVLVTGSRGPVILCIIFVLYYYLKDEKYNNWIQPLFRLLILFLFAYLLIEKLTNIPFFKHTISRAFEFIDTSGINWEGSSGRDHLYKNAISSIGKSPIFGHGFFSTYRKIGNYPHNLILEILIQGGILYLVVFLSIASKLVVKLNYYIKFDSNLKIVKYLIIYAIVFLFFSGTYVTQGIFWFLFSFLINIQNTKIVFI